MRIRSVIQLHTVNRFYAFGLPFLILGIAFSIVLAIGVAARIYSGPEGQQALYEGMRWNGAIFSYLGPLMGLGFTAMGQHFSLGLGLGLTRREFVGGTSLVFLAQALTFAAITAVGKIIESATNGWGLGVRFFNVNYTGVGPGWLTFVQTFLLISMMMFVGAAWMTAFIRWGQLFLWAFLLMGAVFALAVVGGMLWSPGFAAWVTDVMMMGWLPWMGVVAVLAALGAGAWFGLVRRAQAR